MHGRLSTFPVVLSDGAAIDDVNVDVHGRLSTFPVVLSDGAAIDDVNFDVHGRLSTFPVVHSRNHWRCGECFLHCGCERRLIRLSEIPAWIWCACYHRYCAAYFDDHR